MKEFLKPKKADRVMDVVSRAGVDVSSWQKRKGGKTVESPISNPSQIYRWSFLEPSKVAVLFIWFKKIDYKKNDYWYSFNSRKQVAIESVKGGSANRRLRAEEMDRVIQIALRDSLLVRAVIVDKSDKGRTTRHLDDATWIIDSYNNSTGACVLRRSKSVAPTGIAHSDLVGGLVLAENERNARDFAWKDVTGERYHFPNKYRNKILPGVRFIYYRGTRGTSGERKPAEYFGTGIIGDVYLDPATVTLAKGRQQWLADIAEYTPFRVPVLLRDPEGIYRETGSSRVPKNFWGDGVRTIDARQFQLISDAGGIPQDPEPLIGPIGALTSAGEGLLRVTPPKSGTGNRKNFNPKRLSRNAKLIGDAAERLFFEYLLGSEPDEKKRRRIFWHAKEGNTPGYDIEDARDPKKIMGYEIKGTTGASFISFDFTANEMKAAIEMRERYVVVLVSNCMSDAPSFQLLKDMHAMLERKVLEAFPAIYRIERRTGV